MSQGSVWGLGWGWWPVWRRNFLVWRRLWVPSLLANFGEPLLYLLALGYGLGRFVGNIEGVPYASFLASGIVCSSAMNTATFEGLYSAYTRMAVQKTWDAILATPVSIADVVLGELLWAATKSLMSAFAILCVAVILGAFSWDKVPLVLPFVFLMGLAFSGMALSVTAFANSYDFFMYYFTLFISPLFLFSGAFFPVTTLPQSLQFVAYLFPLSHGLQLVRPELLGQPLQQVGLHVAVLVFYCLISFGLAVYFYRRRLQN